MNIQTAFWKVISVLALTGLVACGGAAIPETAPATTTPPVRYDYALTLEITPQDIQADIEARYSASALIWKPEAGFTVLGVEGSTVPPDAEASRESNRNAFSIPGANAQGRKAWAGGRKAWAGGWNAWAGGSNAPALTTLEQNLTAWQQVKLAEGQAAAPKLGAGVKVAVIDTGVDVYHPALQGKLAPANEWKDFVDGDALPLDALEADSSENSAGHGHGTGVAGIILQVAPEATILPLRVLKPDGSGDLTDVAMAIDWAAERGADILNLSLGATSDLDSQAITNVLSYAHRKHGVYVVVSSGNAGTDNVTFPANLAQRGGADYLVSVGSVDAQNVRSAFSTYGADVSLYAPGEEVYTLMPERGVAHTTGTSFAAPIVAGTLALALSDEGEVAPKQALLSSVNTDIDSRDDTRTGMLDAGRFLSVMRGNQNPTADAQALSTLQDEPLELTLSGRDPEGSALTYTFTTPTYGTLSGNAPTLVYTPDEGYVGKDAFTFSVSDGVLTSQVATVSLTVDAAPELWPVQFGSDAVEDDAEDITVDAEGNLYIVGKTRGNLAGTSSGDLDAFVMKLNQRGEQVWADQFGSGGDDEAEGVTTDAAGNLYVVGYTYGSLSPESNAGNSDAFIAQYRGDGVLNWRKQFGAAGHEKAEAVAVDAAGNVYVTGHTTSGSMDFGREVFVAQYDSNGVQRWFKQFGSSANDEGESVAVDAAGNLYVTGYTGGDLVSMGSNIGGFDLFIAKYDSNGVQAWLEQFGSEVDDEGKGVVVDAAGSAYVVGYTRGSLARTNAGNSDFVIAKYSSEGERVWLEQFGSASDESAHAAAIDARGYVVVTGTTYGDTAGTNAGSGDVLTAAYDSAGTQVWAEQFGSAERDEADAVAADAQGNIFVTGYTNSTLDGTPITGNNIFVTKLSSSAASR